MEKGENLDSGLQARALWLSEIQVKEEASC